MQFPIRVPPIRKIVLSQNQITFQYPKTIYMKQILHGIAKPKFSIIFPGPQIMKTMSVFTIAIVLIMSMSSCFMPLYKTNTSKEIKQTTLEQLVASQKTFVLHSPEGVFGLENPLMVQGHLTGALSELSNKYEKFLNPNPDKVYAYHSSQSQLVLSQVHIYTNDSLYIHQSLNLTANQIFRMDVYEKDKAATRGNRIASGIAIGLGVGLTAVLVGSAMQSFSDGFKINIHW
jgi:hypothetical protein